ncbi:MAG TPA: methyltransferase domain-containing protein, partial [Blastocatellia bacterium]|nr:methyltransferase domain-containing protein [Blastocatellia bacterium]
ARGLGAAVASVVEGGMGLALAVAGQEDRAADGHADVVVVGLLDLGRREERERRGLEEVPVRRGDGLARVGLERHVQKAVRQLGRLALDDVEGEFDTIISLDVFEHLARPEPVIEALVGRLAPGGRLIVTAAFGPTKAHPMHFDHEIDLAAMFTELGLTNVKSLGMQLTRGEFFRKGNVLVFERR